jgi:hypothetical protein
MSVGSKVRTLLFAGVGAIVAAGTLRAAIHPLAAGQELPADVLPGPLRLSVRLSPDRDRGQPLLAVGGPNRGSLLFWLWDAEGRARLGFEDTQQGLSFSSPFSAAGDETHVLEVVWGALWPAEARPSAGLSAGFRDSLWVAVDGQRLLFRKQAFSLRPARAVFGANLIGSGLAGAFFNGPLATVEPADPEMARRIGMRLMDLLPRRGLLPGGYPGPLHVRLSLPPGIAGRDEPLLVGGKPGTAGILYVHYDDERHMRLGFDAWGWRGPLSAPIEFQPGADYDLRLSTGFLYPVADPPPQAGDAPRGLLPAVVWAEWEGRRVLASVAYCPTMPPDQITLGTNLIGWNLTDMVFRGLFSQVDRLDPASIVDAAEQGIFPRVPAPGAAWQGYPGAVRFVVTFPEVWRPGTGEPFVVAGPTGAADLIYVNYEDGGRAHFGVDHWGRISLTSASVAIAPGSEHELTIGMGAMFPPEGAPLYRLHPELAAQRKTVRIDFDGQTILHGSFPPYPVRPEQITYGVNLAGGSMSGPTFMGRILRLGPASWDPPEATGQRRPDGRPAGPPRPAMPSSP